MTRGRDDLGIARTLYRLVAAAVLLPCTVLAISLYLTWQSTLANARLEILRSVAVATEQATKILDTDLLIGLRINDRIGRLEDAAIIAQATALRDNLQGMIRAFPQINQAAITGADGQVLLSTQSGTAEVWERESLRQIRESGQRYAITASGAMDEAGPMFTLVLRRGSETEPFRGVIAIVVSGSYLRAFDASLVGGNDALSARLVRADGTVLARYPDAAGSDAGGRMPFLANNQLPNAKSGIIRDDRSFDGVSRLVAWQLLESYPVYATVGRAWPSIRRDWWQAAGIQLAFGLPATLGLVSLSLLAMQRARREGAAVRNLRAEAARRVLAEDALRQAQKLEAVGRLASGIAHDLNNHLTVINSNIELLKSRAGGSGGNLVRLADAAMTGVQRAATLTQRLLAFSRQQPLAPRPLDVASLVSGMLDLMRRTLGNTIELRFERGDAPWPARVDASQLETALLNVVLNARDAMPEGGPITVSVRNVTLSEAEAANRPEVTAGAYVALAVSDAGVGMAPDVLARAFDPFFTTKPVGAGSGLGLSMVYGFAKQSGGHVDIASAPGAGTTVTLLLPRHIPAPQPATLMPPRQGDGETVLVVEDDAAMRGAEATALRAFGYTVLEAADAMQAFRLVAERGDVDLLFTEIGLTGDVTGRTLADAARNVSPDIRVLFTTSACPGTEASDETVCLDDPHVLPKPFDLTSLAGRVRQILDEQL